MSNAYGYIRTLSLEAARINAGFKRRKDAARELGISETALGNYERGIAEPGAIIFQRMCVLYDVRAEEIRFDERLLEKKERKGKKRHEREADGKRPEALGR